MSEATVETLVRGIAAGESASWMNADFRIYSLPAKRVNRLRILSTLADETRTTMVPRPFAHATPPAALHPGPGENLEWFAFSSAQHLAEASVGADPYAGWIALANTVPQIRSRIGTRIALTNLRNGLRPPQSGHDNPHYFDDIAMSRSLAAVAVFLGDEQRVLAGATADAVVTHSLDGLWCARATALLFSRLIDGEAPADAARSAAASLPDQTWSRRMAETSLAVAAEGAGPLDRARRLSIGVGDWVYSYPITAPETLGFLLAHVSAARSADDLMLGALAQGRNAASLPALAGAATAVIFGTEWIPSDLTLDQLRLTGITIPDFAGQAVSAYLPEAAV